MFLGFSFLVSDYTLHSQHIVGATPFVDSGVGSVEVGSALVDSGTHFVEVVTHFVDSVTHFVDMDSQNRNFQILSCHILCQRPEC